MTNNDLITAVAELRLDVTALVAQTRRYQLALNRIASYEQGPIVTNQFDEPHSAKVARAALEAES